MFWPTLLEIGTRPKFAQLVAALLASYAIAKLLEFEKYGPYDVLKLYDWVFTKIFGDYCHVCMTFWIMITVSYLIPELITYGLAGLGMYIAIEVISDKS